MIRTLRPSSLAVALIVLCPLPAAARVQDQPASPPPAPTAPAGASPSDAPPVEQAEIEEEVTVVATTRTGRRVEDDPTRVEVLEREEIEEKMLMTPGDIVMLLNEMGGLRVQTTSPSMGAATVRVQGMKGRYTRVLSDGLPLGGQQAGGLGLLQIPPMDLGRVEVIKGVASALYGSGAMGGVVNLLSRRPGVAVERELLINRTSLGGTDGVAYLSAPIANGWSASVLGSGHWQDEHDADGDQWADVAGYERAVVRPRLFWDNGQGRTLFFTSGITYEDRRGGTIPGGVLAATTRAFDEAVRTRRHDLGGTGQTIVAGRLVLSARGAMTWARHDQRIGGERERDRHRTTFAEVAIRGAAGRHTLVAGAAFERDSYRMLDRGRLAQDHSFTHAVPGVFVQDDVTITKRVSLLASSRVDWHNVYGTFFSPRVSALFRGEGWSSRLSAGQGFFAPTPLTEETEAAGLLRLSIPEPLEAERGHGVSLDVTRTIGSAAYAVTFFASRVRSPAHVEREPRYELVTGDGPSTNVGIELLATVRREPVALTASYTYVRSREADGIARDTPLTPRHSAGFVGMIESEDKGRIGLEVYLTGRQTLEANPYAGRSRPYVIVGALVERRFGRVRLFLNAENLTDIRQTRWHPLVRPDGPLDDGRWTVDAWAPLDGRVFNGGLRLAF